MCRYVSLALSLILLVIGCEQQNTRTITDKNSNTVQLTLHQASKEGRLDQIQSLIANDINVNARDANEDTPLHLAALYDNKEVVKLLLAHDAQVNVKNDFAETPLHLASSLTVARLLIAAGADINAKDLEGITPLYMAIQSGDMDKIEFLVSNGADVNVVAEGELDSTPLHEAIRELCKPVVRLLIEHGADLNRKDDSEITPAEAAMQFEDQEMVKLLVAAGADATIQQAAYIGDMEKVRSLLQSGIDVDARDDSKRTPLWIAAKNSQKEMVRFLISKGADVNAKDTYNVAPMLAASEEGNSEIFKLLVRNGAEVTIDVAVHMGDMDKVKNLIKDGIDVNAKHPFGGTLLHEAARQGHTEIARLLITSGAEVDARYIGATPLFEASDRGHVDVAELLIADGADINARDSYGSTPLQAAASQGHTDIVKMLLSKGADVKTRTDGNFNFTPLHSAALAGHKTIVEMLISTGADVNARTSNNHETPLLLALTLCHKDVAELLIDNGADVNVKDANGRTPLSWPVYYGRTDIVELLVQNGASEIDEYSLNAALSAGFTDIVKLLGRDNETVTYGHRGPYSVIITDPQSTQLFLKFAEMEFDEVWIPDKTDIKGIDSMLISYLEEHASRDEDSCMRNILLNLRSYNREYSGFVKDGKRCIICNMIVFDESFPLKPLDNQFRRFFDIGCNVVRMVFDRDANVVVSIDN